MGKKVTFVFISFLLIVLLFSFRLVAATGGGAIIYPDTQKQLITDWGYDIKQEGKASGLTPSYAQTLFVTDKMTCLRLPILGTDAAPAHPADGVIVESYYTDTLYAMTNARNARPDVVLFASKKLNGQTSFPAWVKDADGVIPAMYARLLADFLVYMESYGFVIDILGIDNEKEYNEGNITPQKHQEVIDELRALSLIRGFTVPLMIGPDTYGPNASWVTTLISSGWGDRLDMVGTHYYPKWRPLSKLQQLYQAAAGRPVWHSEVHWESDSTLDVIGQGENALATIFDCFDTGLSGMAWWAYTRSGIKGALERNITVSTVGTRPITMDDIDGTSATSGTLITRAFRQNNSLIVWALNNTSTAFTNYGFTLYTGIISGPVNYTHWNVTTESSGTAAVTSANSFTVTLPANTISMITFNFSSNSLIAQYRFDGNTIDSTGNNFPGAVTGGEVYTSGPVARALTFNGTDNCMEIPSYKGISGSQARTCSAWIKTANRTTNSVIINWGSLSAGGQWLFGIFSSGTLALYAGGPSIQTTVALNDNLWHHVAVVLSDNTPASLNAIKLYVDGTLQTDVVVSSSQTINTISSGNVTVGAFESAPGQKAAFFDGLIDDVRIYDYPLNNYDIAGLYFVGQPAGRVCLPEENGLVYDYNRDCMINLTDLVAFSWQWLATTNLPNFNDLSSTWLTDDYFSGTFDYLPVAAYHLDGSLVDSAGSNNGAAVGSPQYVAGHNNQAAVFDGNDAVQINNPVTQNFTICFWMNTTQTGMDGTQWWNGSGLVDAEVSGSKKDYGISLTGSVVAFGVGTTDTTIKSVTPVNDGLWHHVAVTRSSTSGQMIIYIDGTENASTFGPTANRSDAVNIRIGSLQTNNKFFNGQLDEIYFFDKVLTYDQIQHLMKY
jgi:hypothetical protein